MEKSINVSSWSFPPYVKDFVYIPPSPEIVPEPSTDSPAETITEEPVTDVNKTEDNGPRESEPPDSEEGVFPGEEDTPLFAPDAAIIPVIETEENDTCK